MDVSQRTRTHRDHRPGRISPDLEAPLRGARIRRRDAAKQVMPRPVRARAFEPRGERCPQPAPIADAGDCSPLRRTQPPPSHRRALGTYCERRQRAARQHRDDGVRTRRSTHTSSADTCVRRATHSSNRSAAARISAHRVPRSLQLFSARRRSRCMRAVVARRSRGARCESSRATSRDAAAHAANAARWR